MTTGGCGTSGDRSQGRHHTEKVANDAYGTSLKCRWFRPSNRTPLPGNISLNFTYWPNLTSLVTVANWDKQCVLARSQPSKTIGSVANIPREVKDYFWSRTDFLSSRSFRYACTYGGRCVSKTGASCRNVEWRIKWRLGSVGVSLRII